MLRFISKSIKYIAIVVLQFNEHRNLREINESEYLLPP